MKKIHAGITGLLLFIAFNSTNAQSAGIKLSKTFHIASPGGWDYLAVSGSKLYVSHGTQVNILDKSSGDSISIIPNTAGVHGIAFDNAGGKGYTSNGRSNNVSVFSLATNAVTGEIATGENPDAIMYDGFSKKVVTCNGRSKDLSVIDPATQKTVATIAVGGKPETAVSNEAGKWFVNIEDKNEIVEIDASGMKVLHHWPLAPAEGPTGLAFDKKTNRLFAGCDKLLVVMNAADGTITDKLAIGDGCDGVAFDDAKSYVYTSNGEGTMTVIKESSNGKCSVLENITTNRAARTIALDPATHAIYLPTADFEPLAAGERRPKMIPGSFQVLVLK